MWPRAGQEKQKESWTSSCCAEGSIPRLPSGRPNARPLGQGREPDKFQFPGSKVYIECRFWKSARKSEKFEAVVPGNRTPAYPAAGGASPLHRRREPVHLQISRLFYIYRVKSQGVAVFSGPRTHGREFSRPAKCPFGFSFASPSPFNLSSHFSTCLN